MWKDLWSRYTGAWTGECSGTALGATETSKEGFAMLSGENKSIFASAFNHFRILGRDIQDVSLDASQYSTSVLYALIWLFVAFILHL
jgi:hypothetical protein